MMTIKRPAALTRRTFLAMAGATSAALCLPSLNCEAWAALRPITETRVMMGTYVGITVANVSSMQATEALERAFATMAQAEATFSRHAAGSPVDHLNRTGILRDAPQELVDLVGRAQRYGSLSAGAFDITVQPVIDLFRAHRTDAKHMDLDASALKEAQSLVGIEHLQSQGSTLRFDRQGMGMTLDGMAKGHIADLASAVLLEAGVQDHIINAGGDIVVHGMKAPKQAWRVGIASPTGKGTIDAISLHSGAVATSGSYEVYYDASRAHHHLISPSNRRSPSLAASVSVKAPTAMEADALATALSVMPAQDALRLVQSLPQRECLIITRDGRRMQSHGWA